VTDGVPFPERATCRDLIAAIECLSDLVSDLRQPITTPQQKRARMEAYGNVEVVSEWLCIAARYLDENLDRIARKGSA
jgi:hypothetical protein